MTTNPTPAEMSAEIRRLAAEYAHCYSFVGDDTMPLKHRELHAAIERLEAAAQEHRAADQGWSALTDACEKVRGAPEEVARELCCAIDRLSAILQGEVPAAPEGGK